MPNIWTAVDANFPTLNKEDTVREQVRQVVNYMSLLTEQLKYTLQNLDDSNWNPTALAADEEATAGTISEAVAQLQEQIKEIDLTGGGTVKGDLTVTGSLSGIMELLWENTAPAESFAEQTVTVDLSGIDYCLIKVRYNASYSLRLQQIVENKESGMLIAAGSDGHGWRRADASETGIAFGNTRWAANGSTTVSTDNSFLVPVKIYGVKIRKGDE